MSERTNLPPPAAPCLGEWITLALEAGPERRRLIVSADERWGWVAIIAVDKDPLFGIEGPTPQAALANLEARLQQLTVEGV